MNIRRLAAGVVGLAVVALVANPAAGGTTRYVSPSGTETGGYTNWATAAKTIQKAVNACVNGDTVLVTNGTYTVTSQITLTNGATVVSVNGAKVTSIDGGASTRCVYLSHSNAVLQGFTIKRGNTTQSGGGVFIQYNGSVWNCVIQSNTATATGWGGGLAVDSGGNAYNCLIQGNTAFCGGGVACFYDGGVIHNCTIVDNHASSSAGGVRLHHGGNLYNSVIYFNAAPTNQNVETFDVGSSFFCCDTTPMPVPSGPGNITDDPAFVQGYRVATGSPCVDSGINEGWMVGATDLDGNARIANGTVDMGAYEYGFAIGIRFSAIDVTWNSTSGITYQVQSSTNLLNPLAWTNVGASVTATGTSSYIYDWIRNFNGKFYRVLQMP